MNLGQSVSKRTKLTQQAENEMSERKSTTCGRQRANEMEK